MNILSFPWQDHNSPFRQLSSFRLHNDQVSRQPFNKKQTPPFVIYNKNSKGGNMKTQTKQTNQT